MQETLEKILVEYGKELLKGYDSVEKLLKKLDRLEHLLSYVKQERKILVEEASQPSKNAIIGDGEVELRFSAFCISAIIGIMAPDEPYEEAQMEEFYQLASTAFKKLSCMAGWAHVKVISILQTMVHFQSCVVMLDLHLCCIVLEMFHLFLSATRPNHPQDIFSSMEKIMTYQCGSNGHPLELLKILLASLKMRNNKLEHLLSHIRQEHTRLVDVALQPSKEALIAGELVRHAGMDVRASVAPRISESIRITAPDDPYEEDQMKCDECLAKQAGLLSGQWKRFSRNTRRGSSHDKHAFMQWSRFRFATSF